MIYICLFMIGTMVESFTETVAYRQIRKENIVTGRSHCEHCCVQLSWYELIPVISYILLKGKCRHCHKAIDWYHPLLEIMGGWLLILCYQRYGLSWRMILTAVICFDLCLIAYIDIKEMLIYHCEVIIFLLCTLIIKANEGINITCLFDTGLVSIMMILMNMVISDSFGGGDIEVMMISGLLLGWQKNIIAMMIAVLLAGAYSGYLLSLKKISCHDHIAFGPFMSAGIILSLFYGQDILSWWGFM